MLIQDGLNKFKQDFFNFRQEQQQQQQQQQRRALYELLFAVKKLNNVNSCHLSHEPQRTGS